VFVRVFNGYERRVTSNVLLLPLLLPPLLSCACMCVECVCVCVCVCMSASIRWARFSRSALIYGRGCFKLYPIRASASSPTSHFRCLTLAIFGTAHIDTRVHAHTLTHVYALQPNSCSCSFICCMIAHLWHRDASRFESLMLKTHILAKI
jgi:hypothetical protein